MHPQRMLNAVLGEKMKEWVRNGIELGHVKHRKALAAAGYLRKDRRGDCGH